MGSVLTRDSGDQGDFIVCHLSLLDITDVRVMVVSCLFRCV